MPVDLIAAPHSPFSADGALNVDAVPLQAAQLARTNVSGAFICGSTGEGVSMSVLERRMLAEAWKTAAATHSIKLMVHVGHNSQNEAVTLAAHAEEIGADIVAAMAPTYFRPQTPSQLLDYLRPIAEACANTPFYFYDIPSMTGVLVSTPKLLQGLIEKVPNFGGVKYTKNDLAEFQECLAIADGNYPILFGCDEILLAGYALGARGAVGSTYNFAAPLYHQMVQAYDSGEFQRARELQLRSVQMVRICQQYGYPAAAKSAMRLVGVDCGPVRSPLSNISDDQCLQLHAQLREFIEGV